MSPSSCVWVCAFDLVRLEQRSIGVHRDLEFAAGDLVHVGGELGQCDRVEIGSGVGGRQVLFGLGNCGGGHAGDDKCHGCSYDAAGECHAVLLLRLGSDVPKQSSIIGATRQRPAFVSRVFPH